MRLWYCAPIGTARDPEIRRNGLKFVDGQVEILDQEKIARVHEHGPSDERLRYALMQRYRSIPSSN